MDFKEKSMLNIILLLVVAVTLCVVGHRIDNPWLSFFCSVGLIAVAWVTSSNYLPLEEEVGPGNPENRAIFWKLILTAVIQLLAIYFTSKGFPFLGALMLGFCLYGWMDAEPYISPNSDAAGNGMAAGFSVIFKVIASILMALIFFLLVKLTKSEIVLMICMVMLSLYLIGKVINDTYSREWGDSAKQWIEGQGKCSVEEYVLNKQREKMLDNNGLWLLHDVCAADDSTTNFSKEKTFDYGMKVNSFPQPVMVLKARIYGKHDTIEMAAMERGEECEDTGYNYIVTHNHTTSGELADHVDLVWADPIERKVYSLSTKLPTAKLYKYLSRYGTNYLNFHIAQEGRVFLYKSNERETKNTFIGCVGIGTESHQYDKQLMEQCGVDNLSAAFDKVGNYMEGYDQFSWDRSLSDVSKRYSPLPDHLAGKASERFNYQVRFNFPDGQFDVERIGLLYLDKDKSIGKEMEQESRPIVKDCIVFWQAGGKRYSAFLSFNTEEVVRVFDEVYGADHEQEGCLEIRLGEKQEACGIALTVSGQRHEIGMTEMRLYQSKGNKSERVKN